MTHHVLRIWITTAAVLWLNPSVAAQTGTNRAQRPEVLPRAQEVELALSAAPAHLRDGAGVYALEARGFVQVRPSSNGFTCIVHRDAPRAIKPTCYDEEGSATILPKVLREGELLMQGRPMAEINAAIEEGFRNGTFIAPRRPGVAYMLSEHIVNENPETGATSRFPAHIMFYAPNITNADIGSTAEALRANPCLPFVAYEGPHGFIIMMPCPRPG